MPRKINLDIPCCECSELKTVKVPNYKDREKFDLEVEKILKRRKWGNPFANKWACPKCNKK